MSSRTVPKRISDFLREREGRTYCDACVQERLGLKWRQQVQLITATLAVTEAYERKFERCLTCNELKQVTQALAAEHKHRGREAASVDSRSTANVRPVRVRASPS